MSTRGWVIWIIVLLVVIGAGFSGYWYFFMRGKVSADTATSSNANYSTQMATKQGWSFVAFPYNTVTTVSDLESKLGTSTTLKALYRWSGQAWVDSMKEDSLQPGIGYLAYFSEAATVDLGNTKDTDYKKASIVAETEWRLVGNPGLWKTQFRSSGSSSSEYIPYTGFSVEMTDGTSMSVLEAIAKGYVATSLFLENNNPSYAYLKLYDLTGSYVPNFSGFWFKTKSDTVAKLTFSSTGEAVDTTYTTTDLQAGSDLSAPATP